MNADQRAAALARCEQATPGPWATRGERNVFPSDGNRGYGILWDQHPSRDQLLRDAEFIAHARQDLPAALAALTAAEQRIERLTEAAQNVLRWHRIDCGCLGATCGYGAYLAPLRAALGEDKQGEPE